MKRFFKIFLLGFLGLVGLVVLISFIAMPFLPIFRDGKVFLTVRNSSQSPISVSIEVMNLDINKAEEKSVHGMDSVEPTQEKFAEISLDGWAPESCWNIYIKTNES